MNSITDPDLGNNWRKDFKLAIGGVTMFSLGGDKIMPDTKIKAVSEVELDKFLSSIGESSRVESGQAHCLFCDKVITLSNLHAIIPADDKVEYCCDSDFCIAKMAWGDN